MNVTVIDLAASVKVAFRARGGCNVGLPVIGLIVIGLDVVGVSVKLSWMVVVGGSVEQRHGVSVGVTVVDSTSSGCLLEQLLWGWTSSG